MRILITGSNGIVGKEIVNLLSKDKKHKLVLLTIKKLKKEKKELNFFIKILQNQLIINSNTL